MLLHQSRLHAVCLKINVELPFWEIQPSHNSNTEEKDYRPSNFIYTGFLLTSCLSFSMVTAWEQHVAAVLMPHASHAPGRSCSWIGSPEYLASARTGPSQPRNNLHVTMHTTMQPAVPTTLSTFCRFHLFLPSRFKSTISSPWILLLPVLGQSIFMDLPYQVIYSDQAWLAHLECGIYTVNGRGRA